MISCVTVGLSTPLCLERLLPKWDFVSGTCFISLLPTSANYLFKLCSSLVCLTLQYKSSSVFYCVVLCFNYTSSFFSKYKFPTLHDDTDGSGYDLDSSGSGSGDWSDQGNTCACVCSCVYVFSQTAHNMIDVCCLHSQQMRIKISRSTRTAKT